MNISQTMILIIGLSIISIAIIAVLSTQQTEINAIENQLMLEDNLIFCENIIYSVSPYNLVAMSDAQVKAYACIEEAFYTYGNDYQIEQYEITKAEIADRQTFADSFLEKGKQVCNEMFMGQFYELRKCLADNEDAVYSLSR